MSDVIVLPSALKHGLSEDALRGAWVNFVRKRPRGVDCWVAIGFDSAGNEVEMVALVTAANETLIIHGFSPATEKVKRDLGLVR